MLLGSNRLYLEPHVRRTLRWVFIAVVTIPVTIMLLRHFGSTAPRFCDGTTATSPCIYTIGLRNEDTVQYLNKQGTHVLAVEADPRKAQTAQVQFADAVSAERLLIRNVVIAGSGLPYWTNTANASLSGFDKRIACPSGATATCHEQIVPAATCRKLLARHGTPRYAAVIERDRVSACLASVKDVRRTDLPVYISVAGVSTTAILSLADLGYNRFKLVHETATTAAAWGKEARDVSTGSAWASLDAAFQRLGAKNTANVIHAMRT